MSRGRAYPIMKRTSHIALTLGEINPSRQVKETKEEVVKFKSKPVDSVEDKKPKVRIKKIVKK